MTDYLHELAHQIAYHPKLRGSLFRDLSPTERGAVFALLSPTVQSHVLELISDDEAVELLDQLDLQHAQSALYTMRSEHRRDRIIARLKTELGEKAEYFLRFHPKATLSLLNFNYVLLPVSATVDQAGVIMDQHYRRTGKFPEILAHDETGALAGEVPVSTLVRENIHHKLERYVVSVRTVDYTADIPDIIHAFNDTRHRKVIVLDHDQSVVGIVYSDDALQLFGNQPATSLYDFAGVSDEERTFDSVGSKVRHRYKWLIINLMTAFMAAGVVSLFEHTLDQLVLLAVYMPIVAGMGGNAATQTLAVIVRGIAIGEVSLKNGMPAIWREVGSGFVNGLINGIIVALVATLWNGSPMLGLVIGVAMIFNLVVAGFFGAFVPLLMKKFGKDPATSATIFITTATDVLGFFVFLGLASLLLV